MTNKVIDSMMSHRSIRSYTDEPVDEKELDCIIRSVQAAPNWVNLQLVSVIAIKDARRRKLFSHLCGDQPHIAEAPVFLIFCADYNRVNIACKEKGQTLDEVMQDIDTVIVGAHETGIALEAATVAAESLGLEQYPSATCARTRGKSSANSNCRSMCSLCWDCVAAIRQTIPD